MMDGVAKKVEHAGMDDYLTKPIKAEIIKRVITLKQLIRDNNRELLKITAHGFKGESLTLGASYLSDLCKKMEFLALDGKIEEINNLVEQIGLAAEQTITALISRRK
ncbi:MAG: response regulator [Pseudomonadota bacterium]